MGFWDTTPFHKKAKTNWLWHSHPDTVYGRTREGQNLPHRSGSHQRSQLRSVTLRYTNSNLPVSDIRTLIGVSISQLELGFIRLYKNHVWGCELLGNTCDATACITRSVAGGFSSVPRIFKSVRARPHSRIYNSPGWDGASILEHSCPMHDEEANVGHRDLPEPRFLVFS